MIVLRENLLFGGIIGYWVDGVMFDGCYYCYYFVLWLGECFVCLVVILLVDSFKEVEDVVEIMVKLV